MRAPMSLQSLDHQSAGVAIRRASAEMFAGDRAQHAAPLAQRDHAPQPLSVELLRGRTAIGPYLPELVELARQSGQPAAGLYTEHFLGQPYTGGKVPHLLLFREPPTGGASEHTRGSRPALPSALSGAVLVHEYRRFGLSLRLFVGEDTAGERNVIAAPELRFALALHAAKLLLRDRASLVLLALAEDGAAVNLAEDMERLEPGGYRLATPSRVLARRLPLQQTYQATLATLGAHTRRNLRAYRRRAEEGLGSRFVAQVAISETEFVALNRQCAYPTPDEVARWRYRAARTLPGGVLCGMLDRTGAWIGLLGGRRCNGTLYIDWQLNRLGIESFSPSTVLRAYVLEHESRLGTHTLLFEGGTPHSIRHSFVQDRITDLLAMRRRSVFALGLRASVSHLLPARHPLVEALRHPELVWRED